jgi:hypothetical protein
LRDYENPPKNCDLLCIYDDNQIEQLINNPNISIQNVLKIRATATNLLNNNVNDNNNDQDIIFTNDVDISDDEEIGNNSKSYLETFTIDNSETINIDDI